MKIKKIIPIVLCLSMLFGNIVPVFATEATEETEEIEENKVSEVPATLSRPETFNVTIPKKIVFTNKSKAIVCHVKGDIAENSYINVESKSINFTNSQGKTYLAQCNYYRPSYTKIYWGEKTGLTPDEFYRKLKRTKQELINGIDISFDYTIMNSETNSPITSFSDIDPGTYTGTTTYTVSLNSVASDS